MKRNHIASAALATLAGLSASSGTLAQASDGASFNFSGFGTVGAVRTDTDQAEYVIPGQVKGAKKSFDFNVDSKLGVQGVAKFGPMFSATAQVLARYDFNDKWTPEVEWLFAKAQVTPQLGIRAGRMGLPAFVLSDFRAVDYANLWVRPPLDVYMQVPVSHFDGADLIWQQSLGGVSVTAQVFAGKSNSKYERTPIELRSLVGFNLTAELDDGITLRVGHFQTKLTVVSSSLAGLLAGIRTTPFASVADQIDPTSKKATFSGIGGSFDRGNVVASFEYTKRTTESYVPSTTGWYASGGYRLGNFTPYVAVSQLKRDDTNVVNTIPYGVAPGLDFLAANVDGLIAGQLPDQKTTALGVRWDAMRNTAVKLQFEQIKPVNGGQFTNTAPGFANQTVNAVGVSVNFVF